MTWGEIKRIVLQKVFAITDGVVVNSDITREYLTALPGAANEGLQLLATAGRFLKRRHDLTVDAPGPWFYDLGELLSDFYSLDNDGVYVVRPDGSGGLRGKWSLQGTQTLVLMEAGDWTVWYNAYPAAMTSETEDDYVLPMHPEAVVLLPLYIASQVYKDDDIAIATQYRNEFEVGREALIAAAARAGATGGVGGGGGGGLDGEWRCTTNWL